MSCLLVYDQPSRQGYVKPPWCCRQCGVDIALREFHRGARESQFCWATAADMERRGLMSTDRRPVFCTKRCRLAWARSA